MRRTFTWPGWSLTIELKRLPTVRPLVAVLDESLNAAALMTYADSRASRAGEVQYKISTLLNSREITIKEARPLMRKCYLLLGMSPEMVDARLDNWTQQREAMRR